LEDEKEKLPMVKNECHLRKINFEDGVWSIEIIQSYQDDDYLSNSYLVKIISNGKYLFSPDNNGKVFIWNLKSGNLVSILNDHLNNEVRDIMIFDSFLFTCGDDSSVLIYSSK
jgi:WD40 repeat protein